MQTKLNVKTKLMYQLYLPSNVFLVLCCDVVVASVDNRNRPIGIRAEQK